MAKNKIPATYTLDADVHSWINNKLGKKSTFVNRILLTAMLDERIAMTSKKKMPGHCPSCFSKAIIDGVCGYCGRDCR